MASVREVSGIAEDLLCPVCLSIFQDPRMLGCGHNYCLSCLESCVPKGQHQGTCPECRDPFDLQNAARNRVLANLAEKARLLKLEEGSQSVGAGSWYFCEEHEEPLKLFCSQDEAPVCVICRDLPQHQGHNFLPIKNAVKCYQDKLKASLDPLEDGVKWATNNQSCQQEAIEELENLSEHLCGCIFIEFEELRDILNEREQSMLETVKQMKGLNLADMEGKLEYLKAFEASHSETISSIRTALEETNEFAFLKEVKELMGRIQDRLSERKEETGSEVGEDGRGSKEREEKDNGSNKVNEHQQDGKEGDEAISEEGEAYGEPQEDEDTKEEDYEDIVPVDPSLENLEEMLYFETWKEMLRSISIGEAFAPESYYSSSPTLEEDILQPGDNNISVAVEEEAQAKLISTTKTGTGDCSVDKQTSLPSNSFNIAPPMGGAPCLPPLLPSISNFQVPIFQQLPPYNSMQGWGPPRSWTPRPKQGPPGMSRGRGTPHRQPFCLNWGQGRGYPTIQMSQPCRGNLVSHSIWRPPQNQPPKAREAHVVGQRGGWLNKQKPPSSGGSTSSQSGGGSAKKETPQPREAHGSRQGGSGQGQGSAKKPPAPHKGGEVSSVSKGPQNRPRHGGGRGHGRGSSSAKGPRNK